MAWGGDNMNTIDREIVFITDNWEKDTIFSIARKDIEGNTQKAAMGILDELQKISNHITIYRDPKNFALNINKHQDAIILNTYYGVASPNSKAIIPAICEASNLSYVGANSYAQMLCNDKYMCKKYIQDFGLKVPEGVLMRTGSKWEYTLMKTLKLPLVVKPNFGGGSNGISVNNLVNTYEDALELVFQLLKFQKMPILVEEYIPGYEIEMIIFGNKSVIKLESEIKIQIDGKDYFENQLWGYEAKKAGFHKNALIPSKHLSHAQRQKLCVLFQSFEKMEIMRIDCRVFEGEVYVLELSPDCYLGENGGVANAFKYNNISYSELFYQLIKNSLENLF